MDIYLTLFTIICGSALTLLSTFTNAFKPTESPEPLRIVSTGGKLIIFIVVTLTLIGSYLAIKGEKEKTLLTDMLRKSNDNYQHFRSETSASFAEIGLLLRPNDQKVIVADKELFQTFINASFNAWLVGHTPAENNTTVSDKALKSTLNNETNAPTPKTSLEPVTDNFEQIDTPMPESESRIMIDKWRDQVYAKCTFINKSSASIMMYRGISYSGESKSTVKIGVNRSSTTDNVLVGDSRNKGPAVPFTASYKFYFVTLSESNARRYGSISVNLKAGYETQIVLNDDNLNLTTSGDRENNFLRYAGVN